MKKLKAVNHFFLQDETSANLLKGMGVGQVTISGDTRFDRVADILQSKKENEAVMAFCEGNKVVLAGSTWHPDEKILAAAVRSFKDIKFVITPHEVKEERIKQLISTLQTEVALYTKDAPDTWQEKQVLIIDTIGVLSSIYRYADIAYIGGAFSTGLHNIQEPAVNGMPVIFGPKYHNFREAIELVKLEGAFSVSNSEELERLLRDLLDDEEKYQSACKISNQYMIDNTGATEAIMKGMEPYL